MQTRLRRVLPALFLSAFLLISGCSSGTSGSGSNGGTTTPIVTSAQTLTNISPNGAPIGTPDLLINLRGTGFTPASIVYFNNSALTPVYNSSTSLSATIPASFMTTPGSASVSVSPSTAGGPATTPSPFTSYIAIPNNSMVYNSVNGLLYVSVPSSTGAPYGNTVVSVDPATGALGRPIPVGSEPDRLAISSDGTVLWVGLDGASAVRKVDLVLGVASYQFSLGGNAGFAEVPPVASALAALPGSLDSVVVASNATTCGILLCIYDGGVARGQRVTSINQAIGGALQVDGTKQEIYLASQYSYGVFTYDSTGPSFKTGSPTQGPFVSYGLSTQSLNDDLQVAGGRVYTDFGTVYDAETGSLLGNFPVTGPIAVDTTLNKAFIVTFGGNQVNIYNTSDYTAASTSVIRVGGVSYGLNGIGFSPIPAPTHLTRWGTNGLAFRDAYGVYSFRSNLVQDLTATPADLGVTVTAAGGNSTGSNTTYTATITNAGPSAATNVAFTGLIPPTGIFISATPSQGTCTSTPTLTCNLGSLANGATSTVAIIVQQTAAGTASLSAQINASENDSNATNNQAIASVSVSGNPYSPTPVLNAISPAAIQTGAADTTITITGTGFTNFSTAMWNGTNLPTSFVGSTKLTALVPAANFANLGWGAITVSTPAPGGGNTAPLPLSIFKVVNLSANHILYDPFTRKLYASVASGSTAVAGNSIATITPQTGLIGTPVPIGIQPTVLALSSDGQILYTSLTGSAGVARFNMLTQQPDFTVALPASNPLFGPMAPQEIVVQPGSENAVVLNLPSPIGFSIYDFDPSARTITRRTTSASDEGSNLQFLDAADLFTNADSTNATLGHISVTAAGLTYPPVTSSLNYFGNFKINGGLIFANSGGTADPSTTPATQLGVYQPPANGSGGLQVVAPDTALGSVYFFANTDPEVTSYPDGIAAFNQTTFMPTASVPLNMAAIEGNTSYTGVDLIRWGQDGLAALTSGGHIYILRGPVVVPQLLNQNTAATLTAATPGNVTHGAGNTLITVTGSNFIQGAAVSWNGAYRTTTWVDAGHLTVAIPASDLTAAGSATLVVTNPGATASNSITFTIN